MAGEEEDKPHYHGHRARLRARFLEAGPDALADYEMLELVLFRSIPRKDVKPLAKTLIERFDGFAGVLGQPVERLKEVDGVSDAVALDLKLVHASAGFLTRDRVMGRSVLTSWSAMVNHLRTHIADLPVEEVRVLFLDKRNRLIADEAMGRGTVDEAPVYVREIARRALSHGATALVLAHNHPSGDPMPSTSDITMTNEVVEAVRPLGIVVHDHVIIGKERVASFRQLELL